ncbi:hypothetical protein JHW43_006728, partial [Diplocarpon mali]
HDTGPRPRAWLLRPRLSDDNQAEAEAEAKADKRGTRQGEQDKGNKTRGTRQGEQDKGNKTRGTRQGEQDKGNKTRGTRPEEQGKRNKATADQLSRDRAAEPPSAPRPPSVSFALVALPATRRIRDGCFVRTGPAQQPNHLCSTPLHESIWNRHQHGDRARFKRFSNRSIAECPAPPPPR